MKAMLLKDLIDLREWRDPLILEETVDPGPSRGEILIKVEACGVCHTELDIIEGRTPPPVLPMVLGHQVVGRVLENGAGASRFKPGDLVGVGWIFSSCGSCEFCSRGEENLCPDFKAMGRDAFGGYAELTVVPEEFVFKIPVSFSAPKAAPLFCAGAIGYRSLRLTGLKNGQRLGLTGFGASAHLVLKSVLHQFPDSEIFVFARNEKERAFSLELGASWAGDIGQAPPAGLDAIIDTTPAWKPVVEALKALKPGGRLVINAIRKEEFDKRVLLEIDYPDHLWLEKEIKSVANVSRADIEGFLKLASEIPIRPEYQTYPLSRANEALRELKQKKIRGAKVLLMG